MKDKKSLWPVFIYAVFAFVLLLLISNIVLLLCAISLNKYICLTAARAGAAACCNGGNQHDIQTAVFRAINEPHINGGFINRPELDELKFYIKDEKGHRQQMLLVKTVTGVRVPAPFLLFVTTPEQNGFVRFSTSCAIKLKEFHVSYL